MSIPQHEAYCLCGCMTENAVRSQSEMLNPIQELPNPISDFINPISDSILVNPISDLAKSDFQKVCR